MIQSKAGRAGLPDKDEPYVSLEPREMHLLVEPRETLRVLRYAVDHPHPSHTRATKDLRIAQKTWYGAMERLDGLGLLRVDRRPGGKKIRLVTVTRSGLELLDHVDKIAALVRGSREWIEAELSRADPASEGPLIADLLCRLIEDADRRGDKRALQVLRQRASLAGFAAEGFLASAAGALMAGNLEAAIGAADECLEAISTLGDTRTRLRVLSIKAFALESIGKSQAAFRTNLALRKAARAAAQTALEADAVLGLGVQKARRGQFGDARGYLEEAVELARQCNCAFEETRAIANLALLKFFDDQEAGLAMSEAALERAHDMGARVLAARIHLNRALLLATQMKKEAARQALREGQIVFEELADEESLATVRKRAEIVTGIIRLRQKLPEAEWREVSIQVTKGQLTHEPAAGRPVLQRQVPLGFA